MHLALIFLLFLTACNEKIVSDVEELKANQILIALGKYGIKTRKVKETNAWSLEVAKKDSARALEIITVGHFLSAQFKEEDSSSFVQSKAELEHNLERKLSRSLEDTLERLPDVLEARVHISSPNVPEFSKQVPEKTASVLIVIEPEHKISIENVQRLVSGASGLKEQNVTVITAIAQQPLDLKVVKNDSLDRQFLLSLIPVLVGCILVVRRFDVSSSKSKEAKKILKLENE